MHMELPTPSHLFQVIRLRKLNLRMLVLRLRGCIERRQMLLAVPNMRQPSLHWCTALEAAVH